MAVGNMTQAWIYLQNASFFNAVNQAYTAPPIGEFFWPLIFLFTLFMVALRSENPFYVAFYAILGNVALGTLVFSRFGVIFYATVVFSLAIGLWSFFGSSKIDA